MGLVQSCLRHARVNHPTGPIPCFETHWSILKRETLCFFLSFFLSSCSLSTAYWHISTYGFHQGLPFSPAKCMTYAWHAPTESNTSQLLPGNISCHGVCPPATCGQVAMKVQVAQNQKGPIRKGQEWLGGLCMSVMLFMIVQSLSVCRLGLGSLASGSQLHSRSVSGDLTRVVKGLKLEIAICFKILKLSYLLSIDICTMSSLRP